MPPPRATCAADDRPRRAFAMSRIVLALIGLAIAALGWTLVMTVFLVFIGLPLFIFGLAIAQAQES